MAKKSNWQKELEELASNVGASVRADGGNFVIHKPGERNSLTVTPETDKHAIERYLRGSQS